MGTRLLLTEITSKELHLDILPVKTSRAFLYCTKLPLFAYPGWYLAGGTALALQVGHRQSVDLDFFTTRRQFTARAIEDELLTQAEWETTLRRKGTLYGKLLGAKISLISYPFFVPSSHQIRCGTVRILIPSDIAAMKIIAISQRGRKRDFIDLYWYCLNREPLRDVVARALGQYPGQEHNLPHILKSLVFFDDAEADPMPRVFFAVTWAKVKKFFQHEVNVLTRHFLDTR